MDVPPDVRIKVTIQTGAVYYFASSQITSEEPHYCVVLNNTPNGDDSIVLAVASSQVDKRKAFVISRNLPQDTLVEVLPSESPIFTKHTVFDCNSVIQEPMEVLIEKLSCGELKIKSQLPDSILQNILTGVQSSPMVEKRIKKMLPRNSE